MRKNKYNVAAKEDRTSDDGIVFHSRKEMLAWVNQFRPLMRSGMKVERQVQFPLYAYAGAHAVHVADYVADFVVFEKRMGIYDTKGFATPVYKLKRDWFHACYPHLRIVEL